jgi:hypothetical protein
MKNLIYLFFVILLFSCSQPKDKSGQEFKIEQTENEQVEESNIELDSNEMPTQPAGSSMSLTCDCTCDCNGKSFTTSIYPCKNKELACEKACKQKCK